MKLRHTALLGFTLLLSATAQAAPVLMISVDGLRPADVLEAKARGIKVPTLAKLAAGGAYATGVRNVLPTVTYPNHTTLITGVWPSRHGIAIRSKSRLSVGSAPRRRASVICCT